MNYEILATELADARYASTTDNEAAQIINAKSESDPNAKNVSVSDLKHLCVTTPLSFDNGTTQWTSTLWLVVKDKAANGSIPSGQLWDIFNDKDFATIDFVDGGLQRMMLIAGLSEIVADTEILFNEADKTNVEGQVLALAQKVSRADILGIGYTRQIDVAIARGK